MNSVQCQSLRSTTTSANKHCSSEMFDGRCDCPPVAKRNCRCNRATCVRQNLARLQRVEAAEHVGAGGDQLLLGARRCHARRLTARVACERASMCAPASSSSATMSSAPSCAASLSGVVECGTSVVAPSRISAATFHIAAVGLDDRQHQQRRSTHSSPEFKYRLRVFSN